MASTVETPVTENVDVDSVIIDENQITEDVVTKLEISEKTDKPDSINVKNKKKMDKLIDSILKKNGPKGKFASVEERYYALAEKFMEVHEQNKNLQLSSKDLEKNLGKMSTQCTYVQSEYSKAVLMKEKLENLCRELQKQNKMVKEESIQRIEDEETKRKEISNKFQSAIDEINSQVSQNSEKNNMLIQENVQLTTKLKDLIEQYETREQHIEKVLKHKDLEMQLVNAKLQQSELKLTEQTERNKKEKALYDVTTLELNKRCEIHIENENQLKSQLKVYTQKYEEFQSTLTKSNQVFESFRTEMDKMTKKIKKLENETNNWKNKYDNSEKNLKSAFSQNQELNKQIKKVQSKADIMEQLSRSLQTERNTLKQENKDLKDKYCPETESKQEENTEEIIEENKTENSAESTVTDDKNEQETTEESSEDKSAE